MPKTYGPGPPVGSPENAEAVARLKTQALQEAADHWESLAVSQEDMAEHDARLGHDVSAHHVRAESYRRTAESIRLELKTGRPHCSMCLGDHPNHLHMHQS